jgi:hypothetical protein
MRPVDLEAYLNRQREWSEKTFGPGKRVGGITKHIAKELDEIREHPSDLMEWVDVMILAMDGYWRNGGDPKRLFSMLLEKQGVNFQRKFPMPTSEDEPVEHDRSGDPACDIGGTCVAPKDAGDVTNCIHCGKELRRRADGLHYTWDAERHGTGARPQAQEG